MKKLVNVLIVATIALLYSCSNIEHTEYVFHIGDHSTFVDVISEVDSNLEEGLFPYQDRTGRKEVAVLFDIKRVYNNGDVYYCTFEEIIAQMMSYNCRPADLKEVIFFCEKYPQTGKTILFFGDRTKRMSKPAFNFPVAGFNGSTLEMYDGYNDRDRFLAIKEND